MSSAFRSSSWWLLAAFCAASRVFAAQPFTDLAGDGDSCSLEQLCAARRGTDAPSVGELAELLAGLSARLDRVQTQLDAQLSGLQLRLDAAAPPVRDCSDLSAGVGSGVYLVQPGLGRPVPAYCDLETAGGGWTVIQRRADMRPRRDFFRGWQAYKWGLGELDAEFWWGNEHLWRLTAPLDRTYELRVDMEDFEGEKRHALYQGFRVSSEEDGYRLTAGGYTGDAGDSLSFHFDQRFSTKDRDQDGHGVKDCAKIFKGAWWYKACFKANLNGQYLSGETPAKSYGVVWEAWRGTNYSLKSVEMKIRPTKKLGTA